MTTLPLPSNSQLLTQLQALAQRAALFAIAVGCLVIVGWLFDLDAFKSVVPGLVAMKFNTALSFVLGGISLFSVRKHPVRAQGAALLMFVIGLLTLCEYVFGWNLRIDQWLVQDVVTPLNNYPGRMSPISALNFCLLGSSLVLLVRSRYVAVAQALTLVAVFIALLSLTGYIYGVSSLYQIGIFTSIALHTALTFVLFGTGAFYALPTQGLAAVTITDQPGALLIRRFLPATMVIAFALAWLHHQGLKAGLYDVNFGMALFAMSTIMIFTLLILWNAYALNQVDRGRRQAADALRQANEQLERRVEERTTELTQVNGSLTAEIAQRKLAEDQFRALLESAPDAVIITNAQGKIILVNAQTERLFGYTRAELLNRPIELLLPSAFLRLDPADTLDEAADSPVRTTAGIELTAVQKDGRQLQVEISRNPIQTEERTLIATAVRDITVRKRVEEALEHERTLLRTLIDAVPANVYIKDAHCRFVAANIETTRKLGGGVPDDLLGKTDYEFFTDDFAAKYFADDQSVIESGQPLLNMEEMTFDHRAQEVRWLLTTKAPVRNERGEVTGLVGVGLDITARKQAEAQAFALATERQRVKLLREFMTDVSHDFRTPLSVIGTTAYLVSRTTDAAKLSEYSEHLEEQIARLRLLLDSFVDLAQLELQTAALEFEPTNLDDLMQEILARSKHTVVHKRQQLAYRCELHPTQVQGDPAAITKAIHHVIANALHYTPEEGDISVRLYRQADHAVVEVTDNGIGIAASHLPFIFDSFFRVDDARSTTTGGAGLGLSIARKIIELLKGHIEVESELGEGSVFRIYLPRMASISTSPSR